MSNQWSDLEKFIIIYYKSQGSRDTDLCTPLQTLAHRDRTLMAIRAQLYKLRRDAQLYDAKTKTWLQDGIQQRFQQLPAHEQMLFVRRNSRIQYKAGVLNSSRDVFKK